MNILCSPLDEGSMFSFLGHNGVPQYYSHSNIEPGLYLRPRLLQDKQTKTKEKQNTKIQNKENLDPYQVKRRGSLAQIHHVTKESKQNDSNKDQVLFETKSLKQNSSQQNDEESVMKENSNDTAKVNNDAILQTLLTLGAQIKECSDGFSDMKQRLLNVETSFSQNLKDMHNEYQVEEKIKKIQFLIHYL